MRINKVFWLCLFATNQAISLYPSSEKIPCPPPKPFLFENPYNAGHFNSELTFLVWQAVEDSLEFAASNHPNSSSSLLTNIKADLITPDFPWAPAFKCLFGYHFEHPSWDLNARWTFYYSRPKRHATKNVTQDGAGLFPLWISSEAAVSQNPLYGSAKSTLLLHFNTVDFELNYSGGLSQFLFLKLHGGLKGLIIDQVLRISYSGGILENGAQMMDSHMRAKNNCIGLGPRIGFGSKWKLPKGWSLLADAAGSYALCSMVTRREDDSVGLKNSTMQTSSIYFREEFWVVRPVIEAKAGIIWEYQFGNKCQKTLGLECTYEVQHYWEQNMMTRYCDRAIFYLPYNGRGNLSMHGASFTLSVGY